MVTSCRINFTGQEGGMCASEPVQISRTQPAAISDHMSSVAWNSFCDRIDKALKPLESVKRMWLTTMIVFPLVFIIFMFLRVANFEFLNNLREKKILNNVGVYFYIIPVIPVVLFLGVIFVQCNADMKARSVMSDVDRSCVDVSNQHSFLSFHAGNIHSRNNRTRCSYTNRNSSPRVSFIEVIIGNPEVTSITSSKATSSTADRLVELEGIKAVISSEEYERKRKEILMEEPLL